MESNFIEKIKKISKKKLILYFLISLPFLWFGQATFFMLWWKFNPPAAKGIFATSFMQRELKKIQEKKADSELKYNWVSYSSISIYIKKAVIASEDDLFIEHQGVRLDALKMAYEHNLKVKTAKKIRGGSTITQQLVKNLFLNPQKSYFRKGQEILLALILELCMDKQRILELYLNVAEWGEGIFGIEAASRHYFGISAKSLSRGQASRLAAMLPAPKYFQKRPYSPYLNKRTFILYKRLSYVHLP